MKNFLLTVLMGLLVRFSYSQELPKLTWFEYLVTIKNPTNQTKIGASEIYFSEDFSNGLSGQGDNGLWSTEGDQGVLWFQTFPIDQENGYNPNEPILEYGEVIPNFFENRDVPLSPTRDNGVLMLDADRFNSSRTEPDQDFQQHILNNTIDAALISPSIDLSENPLVELCFYSYSRVCCDETQYALVDLSVDGGDNWFILDTVANIQEEYQTQVCLNMSTLLNDVENVSDCRVRFRWNDVASHYFWFIDDLFIQSIPENDIIASKTWFRPHYSLVSDYENDVITTAEYYNSFEYHTVPDYAINPIQPAMEVTNAGLAVQTGVTLSFTCTTPSGIEIGPITSDPLSIDPFATEVITLDFISFGGDNGQIPLELGEYILEYSVSQDADDEFPENNIGQSRRFYVSGESLGNTSYRNGDDTYGGVFSTLGDDVIWGTAYFFDNNFSNQKAITHVNAIFQSFPGFAVTLPGEEIFFNIRKGSVLNEDPFNPETLTTVLFDEESPYDYNDSELSYEIQEEDVWNVLEDGLPYSNWISFELPNPILVNPGEIYQAEFRVPAIGINAVFPVLSSNEEKYASFYYAYLEGEGQWFSLNTITVPIWFSLADANDLSVTDQWTNRNGIELTQNYPNPFNDVTRIQYRLDETSDVTFEVFDLSGRLVYAEDHGRIPAGIAQTFEFSSKSLSAGVYTYSIVSNGERVTRKLTIE